MGLPHYSLRTQWDLSMNPLARRREELLRAGESIIDLTESNPTRCGFTYPAEEILAALATPASLAYIPDPRGGLSARQAIAAYHAGRARTRVSPERIVLCASTSEAYSWLMKLLCDPGDEILIPAPGYPLFDFLAKVEDVRLGRYALEYDGRWTVDLGSLERRCGPRTRAVVVVQPNNPTGSFLSREELADLGALCASRGLALIADEVFADYPFEGSPGSHPSVLDVKGPVTFTLGGLSKAVGLPQMKLSWIVVGGQEAPASTRATAPEIAREVNGRAAGVDDALARLEVLGDTFLSVNTPIQHGLRRILEAGAVVQEEIRRRVRENRTHLISLRADTSSWECLAADGGWYAVLRAPRVMGDEELALTLLDRDRVYVHPGHFFDFATEGYLVISLLPHGVDFREGTSRLVARLDRLCE
jgi:alanine-synthesizing transaminase